MRYCSYVNRLRTVPIELSVQTINTTKKRIQFNRMNVLVLVISIAVTAQTTAHARKIPLDQAPASGQQCLSCQGEDCNGEAPVTAHCSQECATMVDLGSSDQPTYDNPHIVKGCSEEIWFSQHGGCRNACFDERKIFGMQSGSKDWMCLYCCTGDMCNKVTPGINVGSRANKDSIVTTMLIVPLLHLVRVCML